MDAADLRSRLDLMFDNELMHHGFTSYMRDYELVVYQSVDPRSGLEPRHLRFLFRLCTEAAVRSAVPPHVWARSLDDHLLRTHTVTMETQGYVWGVRCQILYPGATVVEKSDIARAWEGDLGVPMHEVRIEGNSHTIHLVFSDLSVEALPPGWSPYQVEDDGVAERYARGSKIPFPPAADP